MKNQNSTTALYGKLNISANLTEGDIANWADATIDQHRYAEGNATLASIGEPVTTLFPSYDEMESVDADPVAIAVALESGLDAEAFGAAYAGYVGSDASFLRMFGIALKEGLCPVAFTKAVRLNLDVNAFVLALEDGLDPAAFSKAVASGLDITAFSEALSNGMVVEHFAGMVESLGIIELNAALELYNESENDIRLIPNAVDRALAQICREERYELACV